MKKVAVKPAQQKKAVAKESSDESESDTSSDEETVRTATTNCSNISILLK